MNIIGQFVAAGAPVAVTALWQGAVLAAGLAACLRFASRMPAADRFRAWAAGFAALVAMPFLPLVFAFNLGAASGAAIAPGGPAHRAWLDIDPKWAFVIVGLWIAASVWRAVDLCIHGLNLRRVFKRATPIDFPGVRAQVCATGDLDRPSVIGFFSPRILIPEWLLGKLTRAELNQVVLHEAEHLRRRDDWTNLLQKLALVAFPLNPALAWMERRLCQERELACDEAVVAATGKPRAYAACLASLAERGLQHRREALSLGAWRKRPELVARVHRLLKHTPGLSPAAARAVLATVSCGLVFGSVEFARTPQMVAFVAAPAIAQSNTPDLVNRDARPMAGYYAVNAVAHETSAGTGEKKRPQILEPLRRLKDDKPGGASEDTQEHSLRQNVQAATRTRPQQAAQQWIVLTAYEQVIAVSGAGRRNAGMVADYEVTPENASRGSDSQDSISPQWAIARLVVRVDPDPARELQSRDVKSPESEPAQPGPDWVRPAGTPVLPAAVPLPDGWIVFQL